MGANSAAWKRLRLQCYRRDRAAGAGCWLCHGAYGPIDYDAKPGSHPLAYEPDHIHPRATHPELELVPDNIAAAHVRCNRARGKRAVVDVLGSQSREW